MTNVQQVGELQVLGQLMLDHRLAGLRKAAQAKAQSEAALAALARTPTGMAGLAGTSGALAELAYQRWADAQRSEINQALARQTHDWLVARDAASTAFGKAEALRKLSEKLRKNP